MCIRDRLKKVIYVPFPKTDIPLISLVDELRKSFGSSNIYAYSEGTIKRLVQIGICKGVRQRDLACGEVLANEESISLQKTINSKITALEYDDKKIEITIEANGQACNSSSIIDKSVEGYIAEALIKAANECF